MRFMQNLSDFYNLLLRTDAEQECSTANHIQREVRSISLAVVHHASLHIEQAHLRADLCARNLELTAIGHHRKRRLDSNRRDAARIKHVPLSILTDKDLLELRNIVCHIFARASAVRQIFFGFDGFNDCF